MNTAQILPGQSVRNLIIAPQTLSPKNGGNIVDKLLNKCARQQPVSLLSVATTYQLTTTTHRPGTRMNTGFDLLKSQEAVALSARQH
jgi:hypothetical protein